MDPTWFVAVVGSIVIECAFPAIQFLVAVAVNTDVPLTTVAVMSDVPVLVDVNVKVAFPCVVVLVPDEGDSNPVPVAANETVVGVVTGFPYWSRGVAVTV